VKKLFPSLSIALSAAAFTALLFSVGGAAQNGNGTGGCQGPNCAGGSPTPTCGAFCSHFEQIRFLLQGADSRSIPLPRKDTPVRADVTFSSMDLNCGGVIENPGPTVLSTVFTFDSATGSTTSILTQINGLGDTVTGAKRVVECNHTSFIGIARVDVDRTAPGSIRVALDDASLPGALGSFPPTVGVCVNLWF
jgi:hypothetical protein